MAKYDHRILLADSETLRVRHPVKDDLGTVFSFDSKGVITSIRELDPDKELDGLFVKPWVAAVVSAPEWITWRPASSGP